MLERKEVIMLRARVLLIKTHKSNARDQRLEVLIHCKERKKSERNVPEERKNRYLVAVSRCGLGLMTLMIRENLEINKP